jgi:hypothetical protein
MQAEHAEVTVFDTDSQGQLCIHQQINFTWHIRWLIKVIILPKWLQRSITMNQKNRMADAD